MPMARITTQSHVMLQDLAARRGQSHQQILEDALGLLEKQQFFEEAHDAYEKLRQDPAAWSALEAERAVLDASGADGIADE